MSTYNSAALALPAGHPANGRAGIGAHYPKPTSVEQRKDYFVGRDGYEFAGTHLIVDFWGAEHLDNLERMERALREAVTAGGATLLHIHLHHFSLNGGISGVAVLAESHISVHTWPERGFAAFDVFMCGNARPEDSVSALEKAFSPRRIHRHTCLRGAVTGDE